MSAPLEKVAKIVKDAAGEIASENDWGRKRMHYKIAGEDFAVYRLYTLNLPAEGVKKVNDALNITDEVLRFLLTKVDPRAKALMAEDAKRRAEREAEPDEE